MVPETEEEEIRKNQYMQELLIGTFNNDYDLINDLEERVDIDKRLWKNLDDKIGEIGSSDDITEIFRAVGPDEFYKVMDTGKFDSIPSAMQAKQFGIDLDETINFAEKFSDISAVLEVKIPKNILDEIGDLTHVDAFNFKKGTVTIQPDKLDDFNNHIREILHVY